MTPGEILLVLIDEAAAGGPLESLVFDFSDIEFDAEDLWP